MYRSSLYIKADVTAFGVGNINRKIFLRTIALPTECYKLVC
jgi:hypothetical protein